MYSKNL